MAGFYKTGETKKRPGVYMRIVNRGADAVSAEITIPAAPTPPELTEELIVSYRAGVVRLTLPLGCTVTHDGSGNVTLSGLESVVYDDEGNVTIGG